MKWLTALLLCCTNLTIMPARAQCPSNKGQLEVTASYGIINNDQLSDMLNPSGTPQNKSITYSSGMPFVTFKYFAFNRLAFGVSVGTGSEKGQFTAPYAPTVVTGYYSQNISTGAAEVYYIYFFRKYVEVYSLLGVGFGFSSTNEVTELVAPSSVTTASDFLRVQYTPVAIRLGGRIGGFCELGAGYKGVVNLGVSIKFGRPCWWKL